MIQNELFKFWYVQLKGESMVSFKVFRTSTVLFFTLVVLLAGGCASRHVPTPGAVEFERLKTKDKQVSLNIVNVQSNSSEMTFGEYGAGKMQGDLKTWTDSAISCTKRSLEPRGITFASDSPNVLKLAVTDVKVDTAGVPFVASLARCKISLKAETGDGYSKIYEETAKSLNPPAASDNAMGAVIGLLLKDKNILEYLER